MSRAFVFPGQGSQSIGMGKELYDSFATAKAVFQEVNDTLSQDLTKIIFEGPETDLNLTENTQPALMAVSIAVSRVLEKDFGCALKDYASFVAGHSLGEYSALTAVGSLSLSDSARLLKIRGQAMQKAVPVGQGSMAAILGLEMDVVKEIANEAARITNSVCSAANDNSPGQIVISGSVIAIEKAVALASEKGAKRSVILPVSAPFHCAMMEPAARTMDDHLKATTIHAPSIPLVANVIASTVTDPEQIRKLLVEQVTGMVRWNDSVNFMVSKGTNEFVEVGAGKVLSGLNRRISKESNATALNSIEDIENFVKQIKA